MNAKMAAYEDMAVAGIGVAMKITMITGMVSMGIGQGVQPLLGYCTGARDWKRFSRSQVVPRRPPRARLTINSTG